MKDITQAKSNPKSEPKFFNTLDRLDNAEAFKETDRVDGKLALNDFITGQDSLLVKKAIRIAEGKKQQ